MIIASPANPTGTIIAPAEELEAIAAVCKATGASASSPTRSTTVCQLRRGLTHSMLQYEPDALIVVNSFSKYFSMVGWRLGWLLAPTRPDREAARAYVGNLFLTAPSLSQHAGLAAMDDIAELEGHVANYARNRELCWKAGRRPISSCWCRRPQPRPAAVFLAAGFLLAEILLAAGRLAAAFLTLAFAARKAASKAMRAQGSISGGDSSASSGGR